MKQLFLYLIFSLFISSCGLFDSYQNYRLSNICRENQYDLNFIADNFLSEDNISHITNEDSKLNRKTYKIRCSGDNLFYITLDEQNLSFFPDSLNENDSIKIFADFLTEYDIDKIILQSLLEKMYDLKIMELSKYNDEIVALNFSYLHGLAKTQRQLNTRTLPIKAIEVKEIVNDWYYFRAAIM